MEYILCYETLGMQDVERVGGKNASLGEMIRHLAAAGVNVPGGFATTAAAYREFLQYNNLHEQIQHALATLDIEDVQALASTGARIRQWIREAPLQPALEASLEQHYIQLRGEQDEASFAVAVRSSATAEDLPEASFAGQQETFLNVRGYAQVKNALKEVYASLFNDRAVSYRVHQGFAHADVALSAGIQRMVRSDCGASGVMFSLDTESGFQDAVFITAAYGLGETVVQGAVNPDEFYVYKPALAAGRHAILRKNLGSKAIKMIYSDTPAVTTITVNHDEQQRFCLSDREIESLAQQAVIIEKHYSRPMDIEWAKDGIDGKLYIVQARPETVKSRDRTHTLERYCLQEQGERIISGRAIGQRIGQGKARVLRNIREMHKIKAGEVLVTDMTDPDWEPIMKKAAAIVTNRGGRTCHAAIIARELGIPAVVGCGEATALITDGHEITVSCAEGDNGNVYTGLLKFNVEKHSIASMPRLPFKIMMNVGNPERAFDFQRLPHQGVGLARLEFIINRMIGIHPKALLEFEQLDRNLQTQIQPLIAAYASPVDFYIERLAEGIATLGAAFAPENVIVRLSDFKSNEYANLIGGRQYEPQEENPMLGFRGAARYIDPTFRACFELECRALRKARETIGLQNIAVMVPFVRTLDEARQVIELLAANGLRRGENGLQIIMMCELPANAILADAFLEYFDGFSIGSNDLTQLTLGLDRDSGIVAHLFDERNPAVKDLLQRAIQACKKAGKYVGICGQGPSDHPDLAQWLVETGIDSVSLNPDTVVDTWLYLAKNLK